MTTSNLLRIWQVAALLLPVLFPQISSGQAPANQGMLNANGQRMVFKNVMAVRGKSDDEDRIIVLATGRPLSAAVLKKVQDLDADENAFGEIGQPCLKAVYRKDGSLKMLCGNGSGTTFSEGGAALDGKATIAGGRIAGQVKLVKTGDFAKEVTLNFDVPIDTEVKAAAPAKLDPPVKPTVDGKFVGNGKASAVKYVLVEEGEPFDDKPALKLLFTEKDPAKSKRPSFDAVFGELGSALVLSVDYDGKIFGCEVAHSAHGKKGFSSVGKIHMVEFDVAGGNVTGQISTGGTLDTFGEKWDVELKFAAPLPEKLRNAPAPGEMPAPGAKPASDEPRESSKKESKLPAGPMLAAQKLALPKDATDVEYKRLVKQIQFSSSQGVAAVATEFADKLKQQGWKESGRDLIGKPNAILKRELGDAKLTIMIQPAAGGSAVKVFTEGLDWQDGDDAKPAAGKKSATDDEADRDIEDAQKLLKDALKGLPKGL